MSVTSVLQPSVGYYDGKISIVNGFLVRNTVRTKRSPVQFIITPSEIYVFPVKGAILFYSTAEIFDITFSK